MSKTKDFYKPEFIPVFTIALHDEHLSKHDCLVLGTIYWYEKLKDGICTASNESIGKIIGSKSPNSIGNSINKLDTLGYISCTYQDETKRTRKTIKLNRNKSILFDTGFNSQMEEVPPADGALVPPGDGQKDNSIEKNRKENMFDIFWKSYPRRLNKQQALKSFKRLNVDEKLLNIILSDINKRLKVKDWDIINIQYIPHPSTYLNNKRWEDESYPHGDLLTKKKNHAKL